MATRTWDNGASTQNWEDADNWSDNTVPVTGDTAIIPNGYGTISGNPSADVLALVTVEGTSSLNATLEATNFEFTGSGYNSGTLTGNCEFSGDTSYNDGTITGNCIFSGQTSYNNGVIIGNCTFSELASYNNGTITGDCIFSGLASYNTGTINGTADFQYTGILQPGVNSNPFGVVSNGTTISGDLVVEYYGSGEYFLGDTFPFNVTGSLEFLFSGSYSYNNGTIHADAEFSGYGSYNDYNITGTTKFSGDTSYNDGTIVGDVEFAGGSSYNNGNITGNCTFSGDYSACGGTITGDCFLNAANSYPTNCSLTGMVTFKNTSNIVAMINYNTSTAPFTTNPTSVKLPFADVLGTGLL